MPSDVVDDAVGSFDADNAFATPKVGDHRAAARQQNVVGFDVAVDDALFVGVIERRRDLAKQAQTFGDGQLSALRQPLPQRLSFDQRHREERQRRRTFVIAPDLTRAQQRHDMRMLEPGGERDFALEPLSRDPRGGVGRQHFDDDASSQSRIVRDEHARHPAAAQLGADRVAAAER